MRLQSSPEINFYICNILIFLYSNSSRDIRIQIMIKIITRNCIFLYYFGCTQICPRLYMYSWENRINFFRFMEGFKIKKLSIPANCNLPIAQQKIVMVSKTILVHWNINITKRETINFLFNSRSNNRIDFLRILLTRMFHNFIPIMYISIYILYISIK